MRLAQALLYFTTLVVRGSYAVDAQHPTVFLYFSTLVVWGSYTVDAQHPTVFLLFYFSC
ncbi:hypothetical protein SASK175_24660 [Staphylococcus argenteus]